MRRSTFRFAVAPMLGVLATFAGGIPVAAVPVGGSVWVCVAAGVLFGANALAGNVAGAAGALLAAGINGCLW